MMEESTNERKVYQADHEIIDMLEKAKRRN